MGRVRIDDAVAGDDRSRRADSSRGAAHLWVVGDDEECVVIDAPHDVDDVLAVVAGRRVRAILCTSGDDDRVRAAPALRERVVAPILMHPADRPAWERAHPDHLWDIDLEDGRELAVGGATLTVLHTPGRSPGAVCVYVHELGCVFTGDGERARRRVLARLGDLPDDTVVHPGRGADTTVGAVRTDLG